MQTPDAGARCQNCLSTEVLCRCYREMDSRPCCGACEHIDIDGNLTFSDY